MWLPIDSKYQVSDDGFVLNSVSGKILKPSDDSRGYHRIDLYGRHNKLHRLVASRFLPAPTEDGLVIDHIDRNKLNNCASNLRWCSYAVNNSNRVRKII